MIVVGNVFAILHGPLLTLKSQCSRHQAAATGAAAAEHLLNENDLSYRSRTSVCTIEFKHVLPKATTFGSLAKKVCRTTVYLLTQFASTSVMDAKNSPPLIHCRCHDPEWQRGGTGFRSGHDTTFSQYYSHTLSALHC